MMSDAGPGRGNGAGRWGRLASISLDCDNLWSYLKTHGDPGAGSNGRPISMC